MNDYEIRGAFGVDEDLFEEVSFDVGARPRQPDDGADLEAMAGQIARLLETVTRVGGEVCRLRAEVDGLIDQNKDLQVRFDHLREVIEEKGTLDLDDFELACEVMAMTARGAAGGGETPAVGNPSKKIPH